MIPCGRAPWLAPTLTSLACLAVCAVDEPSDDETAMASSGDSSSINPSEGGSGTGDSNDHSSHDGDDEGDSGDSDTGGQDGCEIPRHRDSLTLAPGSAFEAPGPIRRAATMAERWAVCGADYLTTTIEDADAAALTSPCTGLAPVAADHLVVTTDKNLQLFALDNDGSPPSELDVVTFIDATAKSVTVVDGVVHVALGSGGLARWTIEANRFAVHDPVSTTQDAHDVVALGDRLVVADGARGLKLLDSEGHLLDELPFDGLARRVVTDGADLVAVLRDHRGFDVVGVDSDADVLTLIGSQGPDGVITDAVWHEGDLYVAHGHAIVRYDLTGDEILEVDRERRPERTRPLQPHFLGLATTGDGLFTVLGRSLFPLEIADPSHAPDIVPNVAARFVNADAGDIAKSSLDFHNRGRSDAIVTGWTGTSDWNVTIKPENLPPERPGCPGQFVLSPGESTRVNFELNVPNAAPLDGLVALESNDPDEPLSHAAVLVNRATPVIGELAPDLAQITWQGEPYRISDHRGEVMLLKLIAPS